MITHFKSNAAVRNQSGDCLEDMDLQRMKKEEPKPIPTHDKSNTTFSVKLLDISKDGVTIGPQLQGTKNSSSAVGRFKNGQRPSQIREQAQSRLKPLFTCVKNLYLVSAIHTWQQFFYQCICFRQSTLQRKDPFQEWSFSTWFAWQNYGLETRNAHPATTRTTGLKSSSKQVLVQKTYTFLFSLSSLHIYTKMVHASFHVHLLVEVTSECHRPYTSLPEQPHSQTDEPQAQ